MKVNDCLYINQIYKTSDYTSNVKNGSAAQIPYNNFSEKFSYESTNALKTQRIVDHNITFKGNLKKISEKDINFQVTCLGCGNIRGNTRELYDFRASMQAVYGINWTEKFNKPYLVRNGNLDEKYNGETTAIVFPLNPDTPGLRGADNMTMVISGKIETKLLNELIEYMGKIGVLSVSGNYNTRYYVNSLTPTKFMENPKIRTVIAAFLNKKMLESTTNIEQTVNVKKIPNHTNKYNLTENSINIANVDYTQNKENSKIVKDYLREFLKNGRKFSVIYDKYKEKGKENDVTVVLIPSVKNEWDCLTIMIDGTIPENECKSMVNYLVLKKMVNVDSHDFRKTILEYFEKIK